MICRYIHKQHLRLLLLFLLRLGYDKSDLLKPRRATGAGWGRPTRAYACLFSVVLLRDKETSEACLHAAMGKQIEKIPVWNVDAYQIRIILAIIVVPPLDG